MTRMGSIRAGPLAAAVGALSCAGRSIAAAACVADRSDYAAAALPGSGALSLI